MANHPLPLVFRQAHTPAESGAPDRLRLVRGAPTTLTTNHDTDATGPFFSGAWEAGDAFMVRGGFEGPWENHGRVRKLYAIMTLKETPA